MKVVKGENYARQSVSFKDMRFENCNFSQAAPATALDIHGCKFIKCNLVNCTISDDNVITDCNIAQVEFE